jgi:hypothetical protein
MSLQCPGCGAWNFKHENKATNANPQFFYCFGKGKARRRGLFFVRTYGSNRLKVKTFYKHIRKMNNALA